MVRCVAETEMHMNAVERVVHYTNIKTEPQTVTTGEYHNNKDMIEPDLLVNIWANLSCFIW